MSNPYSILLKEYISNSKMSLTEIENEMRKRGYNKNKAYLSNLQNGKMDPPPFDVTHVLCEVIGGDPVRLALTGVLMEISQQEFFPLMRDTLATMIATLLDINKDGWSGMLRDLFSTKGFKLSKEQVEKIFDYASVKKMVNDAFEEIPYEEIFVSVINQELDGKEVLTKDFMDTMGNQSFVLEELTQDEAEYLNECLAVYRKMKLTPIRPDTNLSKSGPKW